MGTTCLIIHRLQVYFFCGIRTKKMFILLLLLPTSNNQISTKSSWRLQMIIWILSLSVWLSISLYLCLSLSLSVFVSLSLSISVCLSLSLYIHIYIYVCVCVCVCPVSSFKIGREQCVYSSPLYHAQYDLRVVQWHGGRQAVKHSQLRLQSALYSVSQFPKNYARPRTKKNLLSYFATDQIQAPAHSRLHPPGKRHLSALSMGGWAGHIASLGTVEKLSFKQWWSR